MKRLLAAIGLGAAGLASMASAQDGYYGKYETPRYTVERTIEGAELRTYEPHLLALVTVRGDQRGALNRGFRELAGYIFGGNTKSTSVSMTAPVTQTSQSIAMTAPVTQTGSDDLWTVTFMMPTEFTLDNLPTPNSEAVRFEIAPSEQRLVLTFAGRGRGAILEEKAQSLRAIAASNGLTLTGAPILSYFDDPFTLPFARRNEVAFVVR